MRVWFLVLLWATGGCASLFGSGASEKKDAVAEAPAKVEPQAPSQVETKEQELKISKVWARMEELENEIIRQKERMRLLERGLITGIVPDELAKGYDKEKTAEPSGGAEAAKAIVAPVVAAPSEPAPPPPAPAQPAEPAAPAVAQNTDENAYREKLSRAHALFSGDHWGQAIAAYGAIAQEFPESVTQGHPVYWIGLSWFHLKEYQLAEKTLNDFLNRFAASPLGPRAQFYLAKTEFQMGFVEKAVGRFRNVIRDFPADEAAKMAKLEISRLDQAL